MARHKRRHSHENSERWLVSYADLLTLLFAFFVVMFASTQTDKSRAKQISRAVNEALQSSSLPPRVAAMLGATVGKEINGVLSKAPAGRSSEKSLNEPVLKHDLSGAIETLQATLSTEMEQGQVGIHSEQRGVIISLNSQAVFPSGGDSIDQAIFPLLAKVSKTLNQLPNRIRLEGNTDSVPIRNEKFRSNWELSAARSIAMLSILSQRFGVNQNRMAIVGYADTNAVGDNETEDGRTENRRVDLVILSDFGDSAEPQKLHTPTSQLRP